MNIEIGFPKSLLVSYGYPWSEDGRLCKKLVSGVAVNAEEKSLTLRTLFPLSILVKPLVISIAKIRQIGKEDFGLAHHIRLKGENELLISFSIFKKERDELFDFLKSRIKH